MNKLAFIAVLFLQLAPVTAIYEVIYLDGSYPISTALIFAGCLFVLFLHAIITENKLYIFANGSGFLCNVILVVELLR